MKKIVILIFSLFNLLNQDSKIIDSFFSKYTSINTAKIKFEIITKQNNIVKFQNNGEMILIEDSFKIVIDDIKYFFDDKILYTVIDENYEVNIYDSKENEDFLKNSLISTLNLKELVINLKNEFSYELETITSKNNINYLLMFKNEGNSDYKILFDSNFDILDIEIFYEDSNLINKIFLKQLKVNTKFNESEVKIDLDNYKDYFINRL
ncbi:MAG: hypothetical protein VW916_05550 [Flavobacteriaceae bacterium]|jgi:hypothetical protein|tara:strand:- start:684 stop:1307 length:624 start_codon:yes stop_codon:yes gene_type:complete